MQITLRKMFGARNEKFGSKAKSMAGAVSVDVTGFSVSFNEYLKLISIKRRAEPDQDSLTEVFRLFDPHNTGQIEEEQFRKILSSKEGITEEDIEEMVGGTKQRTVKESDKS